MLADASSRHTSRWAEWFAGRGHQVLLVSVEPPGEISVPFQKLPGRSRWLDYLAAVPALKKITAKFRPDLVNAHFVPNYGLMGKLSGFHPLAVSAWGSDLLISANRSPLHRKRVQWALSGADLATCDGQVLVKELLGLGVETDRILNLPMGVDRRLIVRRRPAEARARIYRFVSTRSLEPVYDPGTIIRAMSEVIRCSSKPVNLTLVGGGRLRESLERLVRELGADRAIEFTGRLNHQDLIGRLDQAGVYITASLSDSTSVSLLEAMARGLAPVASDIPGNREWLEDRANGLLFRPGDHIGLAEKLLWLVNGAADPVPMVEKNFQTINQRGCWQDNMAQIEKSFLRLIG